MWQQQREEFEQKYFRPTIIRERDAADEKYEEARKKFRLPDGAEEFLEHPLPEFVQEWLDEFERDFADDPNGQKEMINWLKDELLEQDGKQRPLHKRLAPMGFQCLLVKPGEMVRNNFVDFDLDFDGTGGYNGLGPAGFITMAIPKNNQNSKEQNKLGIEQEQQQEKEKNHEKKEKEEK